MFSEPERIAAGVFEEVDEDGSGEIEFEEFVELLSGS